MYCRSRNGGVLDDDEELRAGAVGVLGAGHGEDAALVRLGAELRLDRVARSPPMPYVRVSFPFVFGSPPWIMKPGMTRWKIVPS